jgi:hypothetical protein
VPNFRTARLVGIFNVIFGAQILVCGLVFGAYAAALPFLGRGMQQLQQNLEKQAEASKEASLKALEEQEKAAKTEAEKEEIAAQRKEIQERPKVSLTGGADLSKAYIGDPNYIAWAWTEVLTGLVLNAMLLASGIGLLHWRPWARKLGVWTAALKILRLALVYGAFVVVVVPTIAKIYGEIAGGVAAQQQVALGKTGGPQGVIDSAFFNRMYAVMYSGMGIGMIVIGAIYPAVVLWLLTRPGVKSACSGVFQLPKEPNQPC